MDRDDLKGRMEALEEKLRWQKRAIAGLVVVFLFSASPALTRASKWFDRILPGKLALVSFPQGAIPDDVRFDALSPNQVEIPLPEIGTSALSKIAPEQTVNAGDTLRVGEIHIVNASGTVVAAIGSSPSGNGSLVVSNSNGDAVSVVGVDPRGHGTIGLLNTAGRVTAALGSDRSEQANGVVEVSSATGSAAALAFDDAGDAAITVFNIDKRPVSGFGIDNNGHGALRMANAAGGIVAAIGADKTEDANGWMVVRNKSGPAAGFSVDSDGDGLVIAGNRNNDEVSIMGANENGHGIIGFTNASGRIVVGMGADSTGMGVLNIEGGRFRAFLDEDGNGVAKTLGNNGNLRWSSEASPDGGGGTSTGLIGDFDGNGKVDFADFVIFAANFGKTSG
ncbi:MAG: hypothetical protein OXR72_18730 [Gemmatimonadota bacterium]|nr:hypothetical protein [Gemmatimonadota bacterium]